MKVTEETIQILLKNNEESYRAILAIAKENGIKVVSDDRRMRIKDHFPPEHIVDMVQRYFGNGREFRMKVKQIQVYLVYSHTNMTLPEIGKFFNYKDHTTAIYQYRTAREHIINDINYKKSVEAIWRDIKNSLL
jgi:chromosomal replication initiation ATPase DnaA